MIRKLLFLGTLTIAFSLLASVASAQIKLTGAEPGSSAPGTDITLYGSGFDSTAGDNTVTFTPAGGAAGTNVIPTAIVGTTRLRVTVPAGLSGGQYEISVTRASDGASATMATLFAVLTGNADAVFSALDAGLTGVYVSTSDWGDFDGDGDLDLVITGQDAAGIPTATIYRNDGVGGFVALSSGLTGVYSGSSDWGDFDGDGDLDLVITGYGSNPTATIYRNDGAGGFVPLSAGLTGVRNSSSDWGDFDGDGDLDLVVTGWDGAGIQTATIYRNDGAGGFVALSAGLTGVYRGSSDWGDIDGDGDLDLVITGYGSNGSNPTAMIYRNDGVGGFTALSAGLTGVYNSFSDWGDIDGDGDLDLVITGGDASGNPTATIYRNDGSGVFTALSAGLTGVYDSSSDWGDVDGDGDLDLVVTGLDGANNRTATIYENDSSGGFTALSAGLTGVYVGSSDWGDVDGDGDLDLVITGSDGSNNRIVTIYKNIDAFDFVSSTPAGNANNVAITSDITLSFDQNIDGATATATNIAVRSEQDGTLAGSFSVTGQTVTFNPTNNFRYGDHITVTVTTGLTNINGVALSAPHTVEFGTQTAPAPETSPVFITNIVDTTIVGAHIVSTSDINGNGYLDIVAGGSSYGTIVWYGNDGTNNYTKNVISEDGRALSDLITVDLDGDGDMDILSARPTAYKIDWYENNGLGGFTYKNLTSSASYVSKIHAVDLDQDGDLDLISTSSSNNELVWWENDGTQNFIEHVITNMANGALGVYVADVDGDGDLDILLASQNDNTIAWYENNGAQSFTQRVVATTVYGANDVYAADVDGDGDLDLLSASSADDTIAWWENDGSQYFYKQTLTTTADGARSVYAADVDGDGDLDILSASSSDDTVTWYKIHGGRDEDGDGVKDFTKHVVTITANGVNSIYAADVDGDGDLDILSASQLDNTIAWYENIDAFDFISSTPAANAINVAITSDITLTFDQNIDGATATATNIAVRSEQVGTLAGSFSVTGQTVTFNPTNDFRHGDHISVSVTTGLTNLDGVALSAPHTAEFGIQTAPAPETPPVFSALGAGLTGVWQSSSDWGDFDGDGDLDLVITGQDDASNPTAEIYRNDGVGGFTALGAGLTGVYYSSSDWGDFDGDGDLDLVLTGGDTSGNPTATIYRNDGVGGFTALGAGLTGVYRGSSDWGDFDGDGALDLVVTGQDGANNRTTTVYRNDGAGGFTALSAGLTGVYDGSSEWGDFDGDGDLDLVLTGGSQSGPIAVIYENDGLGGFIAHGAGLTGVAYGSSSAWGDFDGDGDLDLVITGGISGTNRTAKIYENDGSGGFIAHGAGLTGVAYGSSSAWGDIDGDGDLDLVITGEDGSRNQTATIYENDGVGGFSALDAGLTGVRNSSSDWADFDGDGDLDLVITGSSNSGMIATIYENVLATPPSLLKVIPAENATGISTDATVSVTYDRAILVSDLSGVSIKDDGGIDVTNVVASLSGDSTLSIAHDTFGKGITYAVTIPAGAVTNIDGIATTSDQVWSFTTIIAEPDPVVLLVPVDGATGISRQPSLEWGVASRAETYQVQLSGISDFSSTIIDASNITETNHAVTEVLVLATDYYWRVRATNQGGTGDWSTTGSFTTATENHETGPAEGATDVALEPTLMWETVTWATAYQVQLSTKADFSTTLIDQSDITETSYKVSPELSSSTTYYWRFRASNTDETGQWSESYSFTTVPAPPETVVLVEPSNEATGISVTPNISWNASEGADNYTVELSTDNTFSNILLDSTVAGTALTLEEPLQNETIYYWRVMATNSGGNSEWSTPGSFTTVVKVPVAVALLSPHDGSIGIQTTPSLIWGASAGADTYQVQLSTGIEFSETIINETVIADTAFTLTTSLTHETQHWWRVRGLNEGGEGDWSEPESFTTIAEQVIAQAVWTFGEASGPQDYRLVALPGQVNESLQAVFAGNAGTDWQAFWDNGAEENYLVKYDGSETFDMAPGNGFWITGKESVEYSNQVPMVKLNSEYEAVILLHEGWNIISNPLDIDVPWSEVALANGNMLQPIWGFNSSFSDLDNFTSAKSGEAFYFFNDQGLTELAIPYKKEQIQKSKTGIAGEELQIITAMAGKVTSTSRLVFTEVELEANPDVVAPPGSFEGASIRFAEQNNEISKRSNTFARLYRDYKNAGQSYFMVLSAEPGVNVEISTGSLNLDGTPEIALIEVETGRQYDLNSESGIDFIPEKEKTNFILVIGDIDYLNQVLEKYLPRKFEVMPNYPNPFNPSTTLKFSLPQQSRVNLQVFDILGRRVATLIDGVREAGVHTVQFDASRQSSGMYFGVIEIGGQSYVQKMLLIK